MHETLSNRQFEVFRLIVESRNPYSSTASAPQDEAWLRPDGGQWKLVYPNPSTNQSVNRAVLLPRTLVVIGKAGSR